MVYTLCSHLEVFHMVDALCSHEVHQLQLKESSSIIGEILSKKFTSCNWKDRKLKNYCSSWNSKLHWHTVPSCFMTKSCVLVQAKNLASMFPSLQKWYDCSTQFFMQPMMPLRKGSTPPTPKYHELFIISVSGVANWCKHGIIKDIRRLSTIWHLVSQLWYFLIGYLTSWS